jgi:hypothetical protein
VTSGIDNLVAVGDVAAGAAVCAGWTGWVCACCAD